MHQSLPSLALRKIQKEDIPEVLRAMEDFCFVLKIPFQKKSRLKNLKMIVQEKENLIFQIAYFKKNPQALLGYLAISLGFSFEFAGRDSFLDEIYIAPEFRNQGWGNMLLKEAFCLAKSQGANYMHIETKKNKRITRFYQKNGFKKRKFVLQSKKL